METGECALLLSASSACSIRRGEPLGCDSGLITAAMSVNPTGTTPPHPHLFFSFLPLRDPWKHSSPFNVPYWRKKIIILLSICPFIYILMD